MKGKERLAYYFFRNSQIQYEDIKGNALEFIGSYNNIKSTELFFLGFQFAINEIRKKEIYNMLLYENISHNVLLLEKMLEIHHSITINKCGFYLYNYIIPTSPLLAKDCFFLF
jgi:hypothetical protein